MLNVAVGERQRATIKMPLGGQIGSPFIVRIRGDSDVTVVDGLRLFVDEHKSARWRGFDNLREFLPVLAQRVAHRKTARAGKCWTSAAFHQGAVSGAFVNANRVVVTKQDAVLDVGSNHVSLGVA